MKVFLFMEKAKAFRISGIGRAFQQQHKALEMNGIEVVGDPREPHDLVHINTLFAKSFRMLQNSRRAGIPVVVHAHSTREDFLNSFNFAPSAKHWFYWNMKRMYSSADALITPTEYSKSLLESYGYVHCPIYALSNGIDLAEYQPSSERENDFRAYFGLAPDTPVVIGVGLLFERKGLHDFMEVARMLPDVVFIWFGTLSPLLQTVRIRNAIRRKPKNVIMPGYIAGDIIKGAFTAANCLLFPSYEETEGIVVLEAMASRLPAIVRDIPVYSEYRSGREVLKASCNEEFAAAVRYVIKNDMKGLTDAAYSSVSKKDLRLIGRRLGDIYEDVLARHQ